MRIFFPLKIFTYLRYDCVCEPIIIEPDDVITVSEDEDEINV